MRIVCDSATGVYAKAMLVVLVFTRQAQMYIRIYQVVASCQEVSTSPELLVCACLKVSTTAWFCSVSIGDIHGVDNIIRIRICYL